MARRPDSFSLRNTWDTVLDWIEEHDVALTLGGVVLVIVSAAAIVVAATLGAPEPNITQSDPPLIGQEAVQDQVEYDNPAHGYGFTYPGTWDLLETERFTRIRSPSGRIVISYRLGASDDLDVESSRLLESLAEARPDLELIGRTQEQIDGSRSLILSGTTTDESGRPVRFLVITIRGEPRAYTISIFVPHHSDPARVLPRIEEIVSSFERR